MVAPRSFCNYEDLGSALHKMYAYQWGCVQQHINQHSSLLLEPARTPVLLLECLASLMRIMPQIKACYGIVSGSGSDFDRRWTDEMAKYILPGGCFILYHLLKYAERKGNGGSGTNRNGLDEDHDWVWQFVTRDLLLLENQIPFLVVRELFEQLKNDKPKDKDALVTGGLRLFRSLCPELLLHSNSNQPCAAPDIAQVHHLLHLFYLSVVHTHNRATTSTDSCHEDELSLPELPRWIPSAKVLQDSGVRFRTRADAESFLDISFDARHGILEIPPLQLCHHSDALFRNLIAFEQTCPGTRHDISAYAIFMDCLIKTPEDMRILNLGGILVSKISGEQNDSCFFSRISAHLPIPADNYLFLLMNQMVKKKDYRRRKWYAELVRSYCSNPWVAMSVFAAVLLLCFTVLQTFFTVYPYYNPRD